MLLARIASLALTLAAVCPASSGDYPFGRAPDGRPGLGSPPSGRALAELVRRPRGDEAAWLRDLIDLPTDVLVLVAAAEARYRHLGYDELLPRYRLSSARAGLEQILVEGERQMARPFAQARPEAEARGLARLACDDRFELRAPLLRAAQEEVQRLRAALNLLEAHARGRADLQEMGLLEPVALQIDLCAARLRALRLDLDALSEPITAPPSVEPPEELVEAIRRGDGGAGRPLLAPLLEQKNSSIALIRRGLSLARFDQDHAEELRERAAGHRRAVEILRDLMRVLPELSRIDAPESQGMSTSKRHREAARVAAEALQKDPLYADLHYVYGFAADFVEGRSASMPHFDAFLALRGIRHWEEGTYGRKLLDACERYSMWVVAGWRPEVQIEKPDAIK